MKVQEYVYVDSELLNKTKRLK